MSIHDLPPEIMAKIFHISRCYHSPGYRRPAAAENRVHPATLSSVCATWRCIAVNLPWLWSHIDFATQGVTVTQGQSNHLRLMIERSLGESVELSICVQPSRTIQCSHPPTAGHRLTDLTGETLTQLSDLLAPLAPRIRVLDIRSHFLSGLNLQPIVACMTKICISGALDMLLVHARHDSCSSTRMIPWAQGLTINPPTNAQTNRFMEPIKLLDLVNVSIYWSSSAYRGLIELSITFTECMHRMSCRRMARILSSCPDLRRLCLDNLYAVGGDSFHTEPQTVLLRHLSYLRLVCVRPKRLTPLLQLLRPEGQWLNVRIKLEDAPEFVEQLQTFFGKTEVSVLDVIAKIKTRWFAPLYKGLEKSLAWLKLEDCDFADPDLVRFVNVEFPTNGYVLWTFLVKLELTRCVVDIALLECLAPNGSMEELVLTECQVRNPDSGVCTWPSISMFTPQYVDHVRVTIKDHEDA